VPYLGRLVCDVRSGINRGGAPQAPSYTLGAFFTSLRNPLTRLNSGGGRRSQVMKKQRPLTNWANLPHQQPMNCWSSGATGQPPQPTWAFFDQAAGFRIRRPVAPSRMCLHLLQLFRHLASRLPPPGLQITARSVSKDSIHRSLVMGYFLPRRTLCTSRTLTCIFLWALLWNPPFHKTAFYMMSVSLLVWYDPKPSPALGKAPVAACRAD
jgi:hypothetical protein